jgi:hypothetical protein
MQIISVSGYQENEPDVLRKESFRTNNPMPTTW